MSSKKFHTPKKTHLTNCPAFDIIYLVGNSSHSILERRLYMKNFLLAIPLLMVLAFSTPISAETISPSACMEDAAGFSLNCTANDIQLSEVLPGDLTIIKGCDFPGDTTTFEARFTTVLTAQARHDLGIYFAIDGDLNGDGALTGSCSVSSLDYKPDPPWLDLDGVGDPYVDEHKASGIQDSCGDIDSSHNPLYPEITITTDCIDSDGDGFLNLPYCTSWRQKGANELCDGPVAGILAGGSTSGVVPGAPSKCNCDLGFNVPVPVPPAKLNVVKGVVPGFVNEPGGSVVYSVAVNNFGDDPNNHVVLDSLIDNIYGSVDTVGGSITATTCVLPVSLVAGAAPYICNFTVSVEGNAGDVIPDIVTASGTDLRGNVISGFDDASVTVNGVNPSIAVVKTANPVEVLEPGGLVEFNVAITNNSVSSDPVTIDYFNDSIYGDLSVLGTCSVDFVIEPGSTYNCSFSALVSGPPGSSETDVVTASGVDDDGVSVSGSDSANVAINDVPSSIVVTKTGNVALVDEPGGDIDFTFTVENTSSVDYVTITSLVDNTYATDLSGLGTCSTPFELAPGAIYSCMVTFFAGGDVGSVITNMATGSGVDDDGVAVSDDDTFTVNFRDVPPNAVVTKTAVGVVVTYSVSVTNLSNAETGTVDSLTDDIYGDITYVHDLITFTDCSTPVILGIAGASDDAYNCSFSAIATTSPTVDTVTGVVSDNEGGTVSPTDSASVTFE